MADTQNPNPVAASADDALSAVFKHAGLMVGELSAHEALSKTFSDPTVLGRVVQGTMPGIPAPQAAIPSAPLPPVPAFGVQGNTREEAIGIDRANVINMLRQGVNTYQQQHDAKEQQVAVRDYQILMTAMQALQADPTNQHNINLVNSFFEDPKRVKRIQKVLGFEGISPFDHKAQEKRAGDKDAQHFDEALNTLGQAPVLPGPGGGMPNLLPANGTGKEIGLPKDIGALSSKGDGEPVPASGAAIQEGRGAMGKLGDKAKAFFSQFPDTPYQQAILSPQGLLMKTLIDNKLIPDADQQAKTDAEMYGHKVGLVKDMFTQLNQRDLEQMKARVDVLKTKMTTDNAASIAWLEHMDRVSAQKIEAYKAALSKNSNDIAMAQLLLNTQKSRVEFAQQKLTNLMNVATQNMKNVDGDKLQTTNEEVRKAFDELNAEMGNLDQIKTEYFDRIGKHGVPSRAGRSAEANVGEIESELGLNSGANAGTSGAANAGAGKSGKAGSKLQSDGKSERGGITASQLGAILPAAGKFFGNLRDQFKETE